MVHDWEGAKEYYISAGWHSGTSMKDAAEKYNIPYQSVRRRAAKELWRLERERRTINDPECTTVEEYIYWYY